MRGLLILAAGVLFAPAPVLAQAAANADEPGWRPAGQHRAIDHSTIDRSQFPRQMELSGTSAPADAATAEMRPLALSQSPEMQTVESPVLQPEPMNSYYPETIVSPRAGYPVEYVAAPSWIARESITLQGTWLPAGDNDLGWSDLDLQMALTFPRVKNLTVTPGLQFHFLNGPTRTDLPERLYNQQIEFRWRERVSRPLWYEFAITPGLYSDFEQGSSEAFRLKAQFLAIFAFSRETQMVAGLYYLDRFDIDFLPIFGLIHTPRDDVRLNLVFPAPKLARRVRQGGWNEEWWLYLSGEFGGGAWAIERPPAAGGPREEQFAYRDWRMILGIERLVDDRRSLFFEVGYVFNRELEYDSGRGDFDPDGTAMLRAGVSY